MPQNTYPVPLPEGSPPTSSMQRPGNLEESIDCKYHQEGFRAIYEELVSPGVVVCGAPGDRPKERIAAIDRFCLVKAPLFTRRTESPSFWTYRSKICHLFANFNSSDCSTRTKGIMLR